MRNQVLAVVLSAVVLFFWGFLSWAVLPWHNSVANTFVSERDVAEVLKSNAPVAGIYYLPFSEQDYKVGEATAFVNVLPDGLDMNMGKMMGIAIFGQLIATILVLLLLRLTTGLSYWQRVAYVALVGLTIGFVSHFPYWNWFGFSTPYVLVIIIDSVIAWSLAGLVMAKFITGRRR